MALWCFVFAHHAVSRGHVDAASYDCADAANQACVAKDEGMSLLQLRDSFNSTSVLNEAAHREATWATREVLSSRTRSGKKGKKGGKKRGKRNGKRNGKKNGKKNGKRNGKKNNKGKESGEKEPPSYKILSKSELEQIGFSAKGDHVAKFPVALEACRKLGGELPNRYDKDEVIKIITACNEGKKAIGGTNYRGCWSGVVDISSEGSAQDNMEQSKGHVHGLAMAADAKLAWVGPDFKVGDKTGDPFDTSVWNPELDWNTKDRDCFIHSTSTALPDHGGGHFCRDQGFNVLHGEDCTRASAYVLCQMPR